MICLDTNFLIRALIPGTKEALAIEQWLGSKETLSIPAVAWYEFLCGSTDEEERLAFALLQGGLLPFTPAEAQVAASVFRSLQKPRRLRVDAMIAATAIVAKAPLATNNGDDFAPFIPHGLGLL
jgi:predicted nucleic acid-binding protein